MDRLDPQASLLLVVDMQERLARAMPAEAFERVVGNAILLLETARVLGVPVVASEQYPKGLGATVAPVAEKLRALGVVPIDKLVFDATSEPRIASALADRSPQAVVVLGIEAHVCVFQTARGLIGRALGDGERCDGHAVDVRVVADAVASRREENRLLGLSMCERAGAILMPAESVAFDWLGCAGTDEFRAIAKLVR